MTEALAELWHRRIREEWGFADEDGPSLAGLFRQQYRGSRYSWGYPACPDLEDQAKLAELLEIDRIGVDAHRGVPPRARAVDVGDHRPPPRSQVLRRSEVLRLGDRAVADCRQTMSLVTAAFTADDCEHCKHRLRRDARIMAVCRRRVAPIARPREERAIATSFAERRRRSSADRPASMSSSPRGTASTRATWSLAATPMDSVRIAAVVELEGDAGIGGRAPSSPDHHRDVSAVARSRRVSGTGADRRRTLVATGARSPVSEPLSTDATCSRERRPLCSRTATRRTEEHCRGDRERIACHDR